MSRRSRIDLIAALVFVLIARATSAQTPAESGGVMRHVSFGADITAAISRPDEIAFFNYTDYEHNALRVARIRVMGQWRVVSRLTFVGEVRTEDGDGIDMAAIYARWRPWSARDFTVQAGRVPPVIGAFPRRAYGRDNLVIGFPLAYQYLMSLRPDALPASVDDLLRMRARGWQPSYPIGSQALRPGLPLASAFRWDTGAQVYWRHNILGLAGAVTRGAPADPVVRDHNSSLAWSGRMSLQWPGGPEIGVSGAMGGWVDDGVRHLATSTEGSSHQVLIGVDADYGLGRWLVRGEWLRSTFDLPLRSAAGASRSLPAWSGFVEGRYKLTTRLQIAARVDRLEFGRIVSDVTHVETTWDANVDRVEGALAIRITRRADVKVGWQQNWRDGGRVRTRAFPALAVQYWF
jgi:hypothetical protein